MPVPTLEARLRAATEPLDQALQLYVAAAWQGALGADRPNGSDNPRWLAAGRLRQEAALVLDKHILDMVKLRSAPPGQDRELHEGLDDAEWQLRRQQAELDRGFGGPLTAADDRYRLPAAAVAFVTDEHREALERVVVATHAKLARPRDAGLATEALRAGTKLTGLLAKAADGAVRLEKDEEAAAEALLRRDLHEQALPQAVGRVLHARAIVYALRQQALVSASTSDDPTEPSPRARLMGEAAVMAAFADQELERVLARESKRRTLVRVGGEHTDPQRRAEAQRLVDRQFQERDEWLDSPEARDIERQAARIRLRFDFTPQPPPRAVTQVREMAVGDAGRETAFIRDREPAEGNARLEHDATRAFEESVRRYVKETRPRYARHAASAEGRRQDASAWAETAAPGLGSIRDTSARERGAGSHEPEQSTGSHTAASAERSSGSGRDADPVQLEREP